MKNTRILLFVVGATKIKWYLVIGLVMISLLSCDVEEIPGVIYQPPECTLAIQVPGINQSFTVRYKFDEHQLTLLKDAAYDFTFLSTDAGGDGFLILFAALDFMDFSNLSLSVEQVENEFSKNIRRSADIHNAITALSMTGEIALIGLIGRSFNLELEAHDFTSPANSTYASLIIHITDDHDRVRL